MTGREATYQLKKLALKIKATRTIEILSVSTGLSGLAFALVRLTTTLPYLPEATAIVVFAAVLIQRIIRTNTFSWDEMQVALFLSRNFPELKDSTDLLVAGKTLTTLETIQRERVLSTIGAIVPKVKIPNRLMQGAMILIVGVVAWWLLPARQPGSSNAEPIKPAMQVTAGKPLPELENVVTRVVPPAYTRVKAHITAGRDFSAPLNSMVSWTISFRGEAHDPQVILSAIDSLPLTADKDGKFHMTRRLKQSSFYQVAWRDDHRKLYVSDFHRMDVIHDAPPVVEITNLLQFNEVKPGDPMQLEVKASVSDDYGVAGVHLVATVSKGSGESVKFREEKLYFDQPGPYGKRGELTRTIDLVKLGLEPADELYFYAEAHDNMPVPNVSRTETFFIALQDTATVVAVEDSGLGVDLMPEYFRSQRQIIIDTEKLLAEQRKIKKQEFNSRSNELGFDQKTLRLRYGQFLGEEDEAGIGVVAAPPVEAHDEKEEDEDPLAKFGHQHDTKNEHNLVADKKAPAKADDHGHAEDEKDEDPLKAFMHQHDSEEEATFFVQSIKAKLKAALTLMWDSELHLRMYEPKKSLPFQYRILALLKEISQDSRVYVHRTGFDPPPIKEEKRLTADLTEVFNSSEHTGAMPVMEYPAVRAALDHVEALLQETEPMVNDTTKILARRAGQEVAIAEVQHPGKYIQALSQLRKLSEGTTDPATLRPLLQSLRKSFWSILPQETYSPHRAGRTLHPLDKAVLDNLMKSSRE